MGRKNEIRRINIREIARQANVSAMTVYRVLNNTSTVRPRTRELVIAALNRHGHYAHKPNPEIRIAFDFGTHEYIRNRGMELMRNLAGQNFHCIATAYREQPDSFLNAVAECDVVVYCSVPDDEPVRLARELHPNLCQIAIFTECDADIVISSDNTAGGAMAARHLHEHGHSHIAVHLCEAHPTRRERYNSFFAEMNRLNPACRIDPVLSEDAEGVPEAFRRYFDTCPDHPPTALFFLAGDFGRRFHHAFPAEREKFSVMSYDRPEELAPEREAEAEFDRIEFFSQDILDWAEFYIVNRPMMKHRASVHTNIKPTLKAVGSVRNIR